MYKVDIQQFSGPFNLLLKLIRKQELDICNISLAEVANSFLREVENLDDREPEELASFLEIAAQLLLIKSRVLASQQEEEDEEESNLAYRLQIYKAYVRATNTIEKLDKSEKTSFFNEKIPEKAKALADDSEISASSLSHYYKKVVKTIKKQLKTAKEVKKIKIVSLKKKISELRQSLNKAKSLVLNKIIRKQSKAQKATMFVAALELLKQNKISIEQKELFGDIVIKKLYE